MPTEKINGMSQVEMHRSVDRHPISKTIYVTIAHEIVDILFETDGIETKKDGRAFGEMIKEMCISNKTVETGTLLLKP